MNKETYKKYTEARAPKSPIVKNCVKAFLFGGAICCAAEGLKTLYLNYLGLSEEDAGLLVSVSLIFVAISLTGLGGRSYGRSGAFLAVNHVIEYHSALCDEGVGHSQTFPVYPVDARLHFLCGKS